MEQQLISVSSTWMKEVNLVGQRRVQWQNSQEKTQ